MAEDLLLYGNTQKPGDPAWWLRRLEKQLAARQPRLRVYEDYYCGRHPLLFSTEKFRKAFGNLMHELVDNWMELIVSVVDERLSVEGFRLGDETAGDQEAWRIWQENNLDAASQLAHTEALIGEESYGLVWWKDKGEGAQITIEHPNQVIVATSPADRRIRTAALKKWRDDDGYRKATLYLPDNIYKLQSRTKTGDDSSDKVAWVPREVDGERWPLPNQLEVVPIVPLVNRPRLLGGGESELKRAIPIQNAINKLVVDLMVASEFYSFRARWATGLEIPEDPATGQAIETLKMSMDRVWTSKSPDSKFGEFGETNLENFTKAIEMFVQHMASQTATPPHRFYIGGQFPSGESLKSAESGLVAKARRKARHFGEAWEEIIRLAFKVEGDTNKAAVTNSETIWADFETRNPTAHADWLVKLQALGVPAPILWELAGLTPQQIARFPELRAQQAAIPAAPAGEPTSNGSIPAAAGVAGG